MPRLSTAAYMRAALEQLNVRHQATADFAKGFEHGAAAANETTGARIWVRR